VRPGDRRAPRDFSAFGAVVVLLTSLSALLVGVSSAHAQAWPATHFKVVLEDPDPLLGKWAGNLLSGDRGLLEEAMRPHAIRVEAYLREVALKYQAMGFRAPRLKIEDDRYLVYFYDFAGRDGPPARALCANPARLDVDINKVIEWGAWDKRLYEHLAHELFHTVQSSYDLCDVAPGDFFTEGSAQALGEDMAYQLRKIEPTRANTARWGGRRYDLPLNKPQDKDSSYLTASFWRYLGEYAAAAARGERASVEEITPDYAYLHVLMSEPLASSGDAAVLDWLDKGLERGLKAPLSRLFPYFITTFAGYGEGRFVYPTVTPAQGMVRWQDFIFDGCQSIGTAAGGAKHSVRLNVEPLAAKCVRMETGDISIAAPVDLVIQVEASTAEELDQIWLGVAGGDRLSRRQEGAMSSAGGTAIGSWTFRLMPDEAMTLVASNANSTPRDTRSADLIVTVSSTEVVMSSDFVGPLPAGPVKARKPGKGPGAGDSGAKEAARTLTMTGPKAFVLHVDPDERQLRISLGATPDILNLLSGVNAAGGSLEQLLTSGEILLETAKEISESIPQFMKEQSSIPGSKVVIALPFFDYGFTGSFDSARITTYSGEHGRDLRALGPRDSKPGRGRDFRPSGKVTILEYSAALLEGTFEANFVDEYNLTPGQMQQSQPVLDIVGTVRGRFRISSPWRNDPRYEPLEPIAVTADLEEALRRRLPPGQPELADSIVSAAETALKSRVDTRPAAASSSAAAAGDACDCSCDGLARLEQIGMAPRLAEAPTPEELSMAACATTCLAAYAQCEDD
jgi:hypothetical protein